MKFERNVESIAFAYETDAIDTLVHLKDIIKAYGRVTVKDLMDLVGVAPNPDEMCIRDRAKNEQRTCGAVKKEPIPHSEIPVLRTEVFLQAVR